jgi:hypothetical protein
MENKPKRPRLEKSIKLINKKMYEDYNQKKPNPEDPNEVAGSPDEETPAPEKLDVKKK